MVRIGRCIEQGYEDQQPNTPSKSKEAQVKRPTFVYLIVLLGLMLIGFMVAHPAQIATANEPSHHTKLSSGNEGNPHRPRMIQNSEARQRETLEIVENIYLSPDKSTHDALSQLSSGGGSFQDAVDLKEKGTIKDNGGEENGAEYSNKIDNNQNEANQSVLKDPVLKILSTEAHNAVKDDPSTVAAAVAAAIERPETVVVVQPLVSGGSKEITVDRTRVQFLEAMSNGLESQEVDGIDSVPKKKAWWTISGGKRKLDWSVKRIASPAARNLPSELKDEDAKGLVDNAPRDEPECKINILDVNTELGPKIKARQCNLGFKRVWPFARHNWGIDGVDTLPPEHYQYSSEYWLADAIKQSAFYEPDPEKADLIFVDNWCYHTAWLAYIHPLGNRNTTDPEPYMRRTLDKLVKSQRFIDSKGGDFVFVHPSPIMRGLFKEEAMCEDLASAFHLVPERSSLCVWTQDAAAEGKALIMPYVSTLDLELDVDLASIERDILLYFRGGCGHENPSIRGLFAAGKMLRYELMRTVELSGRNASDIDINCSCDICDNHTPHRKVMESYRRSRFCPVVASNTQSSRRLGEVILAGCIPVFIGPPFHSLPLASDVKYSSLALFFNVSNSSWIDQGSPHYLQNKLVSHLWPLEDDRLQNELINVDNLYEVIDYLRNIPKEIEEKKRASVLAQRFKFYYGPVPETAGGDGATSELANIAMRHMCKHSAEAKKKIRLAEIQGIGKSQPTYRKGSSLMHEKKTNKSFWSFIMSTLRR